MNTVFFSETTDLALFMFIHPSNQIICHSNIQSPITATCKNVHIIYVHIILDPASSLPADRQVQDNKNILISTFFLVVLDIVVIVRYDAENSKGSAVMKYLTWRHLAGILAIITIAGCGAFVDENKIAHAVEKQGYKNVKILQKHIFFVTWRGCGRDDEAAFEASAVNTSGQQVVLTVCAGWPFKGVTIRTN